MVLMIQNMTHMKKPKSKKKKKQWHQKSCGNFFCIKFTKNYQIFKK